MPGEQAMIEAARGWTGPEAVVFGGMLVLLIIIGVVVWRHLGECKAATDRLHARISEVGTDVASLKETVGRIDERTKRE